MFAKNMLMYKLETVMESSDRILHKVDRPREMQYRRPSINFTESSSTAERCGAAQSRFDSGLSDWPVILHKTDLLAGQRRRALASIIIPLKRHPLSGCFFGV